MKISRKYLENYFDLSSYSNEQFATLLTNAGFEVEHIQQYDFQDKLVVGEVLTCENHPDSDHLHICSVDVNEVLQIVCGASNVAVGQKVIVAKVGCELANIKIAKSKVRGVDSHGMLCSLLELGVSEKQLSDQQKNGIEILNEDAVIGESVLPYIGLDDAIFEIGVTPNRSEVFGIYNLLYEIAAIVNQKITIDIPEYHTNHIKTPLYCEGKNYISAQRIENVEIKESNKKIQSLLKTYDVKIINNLVDISNYVMLLTGQPNHMYDARFVKGSLRVVDDYEGEFVALDGNTYQIQKNDLMIFDDEKPLGIAGIMGGEFGKVSEDTTDVILEIANFDRMRIRNTARRLNITSDSSIRYQKNIDVQASEYARKLIIHELGSDVVVFEKSENYEKTAQKTVLTLNTQKLNQHLGTNYSDELIFSVLKRLNFEINNTQVTIPTYRQDISVVEDLYEEVIRLIGYDTLPTTLPTVNANLKTINSIQKLERNITQYLNKNGLSQTLTYTLISDELNELAFNPSEKAIQLKAPLSEERKWIRRSILPSLLEVVEFNEARSVENIHLYELSDVTCENSSEYRLSIVLNGNMVQNKWNKHVIKADFFVIKSLVMTLLQQCGFDLKRIFIQPSKTKQLHPYQSADLFIGRDFIGSFGVLHPTLQKQFNISSCVAAELNITKLSELKVSKVKYQPVSKYQTITRDIALLVDEEITYEKIKLEIEKSGKPLVQSIQLFDVYQGENIEQGKKSLAIRLMIQSNNETLDSKAVQELMDNITKALQSKLNAVIR